MYAASRRLPYATRSLGPAYNGLRHPVPVGPLRVYARTAATSSRESYLSYASKIMSEPVVETLVLVSRITRILLGSVLAVGGIALGVWEGMHQYVEYVAMPNAAATAAVTGPSTESAAAMDLLGFDQDMRLQNRLVMPHTDRRLGIFGRHMVRSAWMAEHWGGGITPSVVFGRHQVDMSKMHENQGWRMAEQFLLSALHVADKRRIAVPDLAQIDSAPLDPTAIQLELWLADVRERIGTRASQHFASLAYEKLYDATGGTGDRPLQIWVAQRLGLQCGQQGHVDDAMAWLDRAMKSSAHTTTADARDALLAQKDLALSPIAQRSTLTTLQAAAMMHVQQAQQSPDEATSHLTSAWQTQLATWRLAEQMQKQTTAATTNSSAYQLQQLWAQQKQGLTAMHLAETQYALSQHTASSRLRSLWRWVRRDPYCDAHPSAYVPTWTEPALRGTHIASRQWLLYARHQARQVQRRLEAQAWNGHPALQYVAHQLLRDARQTDKEAQAMLRALERAHT